MSDADNEKPTSELRSQARGNRRLIASLGRVSLPFALERNYPRTGLEWAGQFFTRRAMKPTAPRPASIRAYVEGSGTGEIGGWFVLINHVAHAGSCVTVDPPNGTRM